MKIDEEELESWKSSFNNDEIYHFVFNYREDFEGDDAYIISNGENFFCVVGKKNEYEFTIKLIFKLRMMRMKKLMMNLIFQCFNYD